MKTTAAKKEKTVAPVSIIANADLPQSIFNVPMNTNLVHQIVVSQMSNRRQSIRNTKNRAQVSGGGIKPWRQKGTGRARHGSIRSPLWTGGGVALGPNSEQIFKKIIPLKMKRKALCMVLSEKSKDGSLVVADEFKIETPKTKSAMEFLNRISAAGESCLVVLEKMDKNVILGMRNIPKVETIQAKDLNCLDILNHKYLVITKAGVNEIEKTFANSGK
jgi:large subunit ribosomal protein L4